MQVIVAKNDGFCVGVKKAVDTAIQISPDNTFVLGDLIHNEDVVKRIAERGIVKVESLQEVPDGAHLIIRSHGVGKNVYEYCAEHGIEVIDCTCSFVKKTQEIVKTESAKGKTIAITGHEEHPEVKGLIGWCTSEAFVFSSEDDNFEILRGKEVVFVAQTTFSEQRFLKIAENIQKVYPKSVEIFRTICYTTVRRQKEAEQIAKNCDAVLVLGGSNSSNTRKLCEIASSYCGHVIRLNNADDFKYEKIQFFKRVGVIAGASTPDWQTQEVLFKMAKNNAEVQKATEVVAEEAQQAEATTMAEIVEGIDRETRYRKGQILNVNIVSARDEGIYVSVSGKGEILIDKAELDCEEYSREAYAEKIGSDIDVMVIETAPKVKLSEKKVKKIKEEEALLKDVEAGAEFTVVCTGFNKGGLTAELGTYPVFVPAREIRPGFVKDLEKYTGKKLRLKLIEIRKERRKEIIASQRVILEAEREEREAAKAEKEAAFFDSIHVGDIVEGKVERITTFGAFVSVNGFDCLAHISDLSWTGVKDVKEVLEIGKRYQFQVLKVDRETKKVSIGYKQLQPQPWDLAAEKYAEGDVVHGKVVRIVPFGAFVELEKGIDGLVHVSQISHEWLENPTSVLSIGEEIDAQILAFNPEEHKITLSIKALQPAPEVEYPRERDDNAKAPRQKKSKRNNRNNYSEDEEYSGWSESFEGASISELLGSDEEK
ncbi:MAG: 4-hydroxy-3-methylbut-2-enyl diphosphate reductase [Clostridia bacterium]|nr:4-hydroxy-3-methylbut-2-enyl diphosphate reductase [Clostridia bacterium]